MYSYVERRAWNRPHPWFLKGVVRSPLPLHFEQEDVVRTDPGMGDKLLSQRQEMCIPCCGRAQPCFLVANVVPEASVFNAILVRSGQESRDTHLSVGNTDILGMLRRAPSILLRSTTIGGLRDTRPDCGDKESRSRWSPYH